MKRTQPVQKAWELRRGYSVAYMGHDMNGRLTVRRLALHPSGVIGRAFFARYHEATAFKRRLAEHGIKSEVVKAFVTVEESRPVRKPFTRKVG